MQKHPVKIEQYEQFVARKRIALAAAAFITLFAAVVYMGIGSLKISLPDIFRALAGEGEKKYQTAIMNIRLPRVLAAIFVGATLAASGAVMQCVLPNPLASASTLGVSQGAAFGAALGIIVFGGGVITNSNSTSTVSVDNPYIVTLCAFVFGSISSVVVILISRLKKNIGPGDPRGHGAQRDVRRRQHAAAILRRRYLARRGRVLDLRQPRQRKLEGSALYQRRFRAELHLLHV